LLCTAHALFIASVRGMGRSKPADRKGKPILDDDEVRVSFKATSVS
jgi:hypothetical protein